MFRNKPLFVVGGGDTACEEALYLTRFASMVYLVHRRDSLRASKIMADRVLAHEKITPIWDSAVEEVLGEGRGHPSALTHEAVEAAVEAAGGNVTAAAEKLGVSRGKLLRLRKRAKKA